MTSRLINFYDQNKSRILRLSRESIWIIAGQVASIIGALVLVRVLTEYLDPAEYGKLALGLTVAGLVNQVVMGGISNGISRYYSIANEKNDLSSYLYASKRLLGYATLVVTVLATVLLFTLVKAKLQHWMPLALAVVMFSLFSGYNGALSGIQNAARQRSIVAIHAGFNAWLKISLVIGMIFWLGNSSTNVVLGYFFSAVVITLSQLYFLNRLVKRHSVSRRESEKRNWHSQVWAFSWPFSVWGMFTWLQQASDRWALQSFATPSDVGQYAVVYQLGFAPVGLLLGFVVSLIAPILYQRAGDALEATRNADVHRLLWRIAIFCLLLTAIAFAISWLLHERLFHWLVSEMYRDTSVYFPWVIMAGGLFATAQMLSLKLMSELRSHDLLYAKIGSAVIGVLTNILGAWLFGVAGVVMSLLLFSFLYFLWTAFIAWQLPK
jgi:O-antigen/teichoic acid export membrane protein